MLICDDLKGLTHDGLGNQVAPIKRLPMKMIQKILQSTFKDLMPVFLILNVFEIAGTLLLAPLLAAAAELATIVGIGSVGGTVL